jgi:hypothetical protein
LRWVSSRRSERVALRFLIFRSEIFFFQLICHCESDGRVQIVVAPKRRRNGFRNGFPSQLSIASSSSFSSSSFAVRSLSG